tara:strand:- start:1795 stop:2910 length:1116 start_codon:yes stop_codon:yes gene_type:complete
MISHKHLITLILGTRPEAIKLAPLILELKKHNQFKTRLILTGQHKEMVEQVMNLFNIKADHNLAIMTEKQSIRDITCKTINGLSREFEKFRPSLVIIQGDTTTAFAGALSAFYENIPVGHVEAGLRTNKLNDPFPEEANRRLISQIATLHFAPTRNALKNLKDSGISENLFLTGNTVIDSLLYISEKKDQIPSFKKINWEKQRVILVTVHRRENWGENINNITKALKEILVHYPDVSIVLPLHKNKIVRDPIVKILGNQDRVNLCEPLDYDTLIMVIKYSNFIITDSGGIQEEAPSLGKPVLVVRNTTERPEAIEAGTSKLIGTQTSKIIDEIKKLLDNQSYYISMAKKKNPYGDGNASKQIIKAFKSYLK